MGIRARVSARGLLASGLLALAVLMAMAAETPSTSAQGTPSIGLDANPAGNTATSLGPIDSCISVKSGDTFQVDIFVADIVGLSAWEVLFRYDPSVVTITDRDVKMFAAGNPGSDLFDASEPLPDGGGLYRLAAADLAIPHAPEDGSGVLARLTLQAAASGVSPAEIARIDRDGNGTIDVGPLLTDAALNPIPPADAGGFFSGPAINATIAVDSPCPKATPTPSPTPATTPLPVESPTPAISPGPDETPSPGATETVLASPTATSPRTTTPTVTVTPTGTPIANGNDDDGGSPWVIAIVVAGVVGALAVGGGATLFLRARRG